LEEDLGGADPREASIMPPPWTWAAEATHPYSSALLRRNRPGAFTISLAKCTGEPGVENMLGHAPPPLAETGLDMRGGHPAGYRSGSGRLSQDKVLKPRRLLRRKGSLAARIKIANYRPGEPDRISAPHGDRGRCLSKASNFMLLKKMGLGRRLTGSSLLKIPASRS
jgi:hypothetical protein